jgi:hypothetical protein
MWIWAHWPYLTLPWLRILLMQGGYIAYVVVGGFLASYLSSYLFILFQFYVSPRRVERRFHNGNQTANYSIQNGAPIHYHLVIYGHLGPNLMSLENDWEALN